MTLDAAIRMLADEAVPPDLREAARDQGRLARHRYGAGPPDPDDWSFATPLAAVHYAPCRGGSGSRGRYPLCAALALLAPFQQEQFGGCAACAKCRLHLSRQELGGRPQRAELYTEGVADYEKMAASPEFRVGLDRLMEAAARHRLAVMCSEADPLHCHRCLLVGRALAAEGADVRHVLASGAVMTHAETEDRLFQLENSQ